MNTEVIVALIGGTALIIGAIIGMWDKIFPKKNDEQYPSLLNHPIHSDIDEYIHASKCANLSPNNGRDVLAQDFLCYALESWRKPSQKFAEQLQQCIDTCGSNVNECNKIYPLAMEMLNEGRKYESLVDFPYASTGDVESVQIFRNKFIEWNQDRADRFQKKLYDISLINDTYKNCNLKGYRILEATSDYMYNMYKDGLHVLSKLNGELNGHSYKGQQL